MVGPDVFSIDIAPSFQKRDESVSFRGSVPFGTPPFPEAQMFVGQRKLEKVAETGIRKNPSPTSTPLFKGGSAHQN